LHFTARFVRLIIRVSERGSMRWLRRWDVAVLLTLLYAHAGSPRPTTTSAPQPSLKPGSFRRRYCSRPPTRTRSASPARMTPAATFTTVRSTSTSSTSSTKAASERSSIRRTSLTSRTTPAPALRRHAPRDIWPAARPARRVGRQRLRPPGRRRRRRPAVRLEYGGGGHVDRTSSREDGSDAPRSFRVSDSSVRGTFSHRSL